MFGVLASWLFGQLTFLTPSIQWNKVQGNYPIFCRAAQGTKVSAVSVAVQGTFSANRLNYVGELLYSICFGRSRLYFCNETSPV